MGYPLDICRLNVRPERWTAPTPIADALTNTVERQNRLSAVEICFAMWHLHHIIVGAIAVDKPVAEVREVRGAESETPIAEALAFRDLPCGVLRIEGLPAAGAGLGA